MLHHVNIRAGVLHHVNMNINFSQSSFVCVHVLITASHSPVTEWFVNKLSL